MCRSKSDPRGYFRCLPSQKFLAKSVSLNKPALDLDAYVNGAFWHNDKNPATIDDILYAKENLDIDLDLENPKYNYGHLLNEYVGLGSMIGSLIDSRIPHFDKELREIQNLEVEYDKVVRADKPDLIKQADLEHQITDKSLLLGYEVQQGTQKVFAELQITGKKIDGSLLHGKANMVQSFVGNSLYFPSQWNSMLIEGKKISLTRDESSDYDENARNSILKSHGKFSISKSVDNAFRYPSLSAAHKAKRVNSFEYYHNSGIIHEMTHMYERNSLFITYSTGAFLRKRSMNEAGKSHRRPDTGKKVLMEGKYVTESVGQIYDYDQGDKSRPVEIQLGHNEVLARGTESIFVGSNGSLIGLPRTDSMYEDHGHRVFNTIPDIEHRNLVLGILASVELNKHF